MGISRISCALSLALVAPAARADVFFSFAWGQSAVIVEANGTVDVPLYLRETITDGSASTLVGEDGVASVGVSIARQLPSPGSPAFVSASGVAPNAIDFADASDPIFGPVVDVSPDGDLARLLIFARDAGIVGMAVAPDVRLIPLGTVTFVGGSTPGQTTTYIASDYGLASSDTVLWNTFQVLDSEVSAAPVTITTAIPTPGTAMTVLGLGFGVGRRRRSPARFDRSRVLG